MEMERLRAEGRMQKQAQVFGMASGMLGGSSALLAGAGGKK
jgi:phage gp45-like